MKILWILFFGGGGGGSSQNWTIFKVISICVLWRLLKVKVQKGGIVLSC